MPASRDAYRAAAPVTLPAALTIALLVAEVAAVVLAVRAAVQKTSGPDLSEPSSPGEPTRTPKRTSVAIAGSSNRGTGKPAFGATLAATLARVLAVVKSPLVLLLTFALVDELAVLGLHAVLAGAPRPIAGWWRVPYHVETGFVLGWPTLLAATCWQAKAPRSAMLAGLENGKARSLSSGGTDVRAGLDQDGARRAFVNGLSGAYLGALGGLVATYPIDAPGSGAPRLRWALLAWEVLCVAAAWGGLWRARLRPWGAVERCLVVLVACETMVATVGPFASDPFTRWWIGSCFYLAAWGACCGVLIRANRAR